MATYYWVGGTGTWDNASTANWSASSGGAAGAGPPTAADNVVFNAASAATNYTVTIAATAVCADFSASGPASGTATFGGTSGLTVSGSFFASATGLSFVFGGSLTFNATTTGKTITTNNNPFFATVFNGAGGEWSLQDNFNGQSVVRLTQGTLKLNGKVLTALFFETNNANTRTLDFGGSYIALTRATGDTWQANNLTNLTLVGTPDVRFTSSSSGTRNIVNGTSGATADRSVSFTITAGSGIVYFQGASTFRSFTCTGFSGTVNGDATATCYGSIVLNSGVTFVLPVILSVGDASKSITAAGATWSGAINMWAAAQTVTFTDAFVGGALTLTSGTLVASNTMSVTTFTTASGAAKTLTLSSNTWTITGASWNASVDAANLTVSASTAILSLTSASSKTFAGGGKTWPTLNQGGAGALTISGNNTFLNITNTVQPATISLTAGSTTTVTDFDVSGTAGNLITLNSTSAGARATLTDSGGVNSVSYVDIKDIAATGYGEWQAYTSNGNVDSGNNVGWVFTAPPPLTASEYQISLKSFTERRSF